MEICGNCHSSSLRDGSMPPLDKLITKWKLWINRDHTFQQDELKELQSHLMEEINFLVNQEGLSEEEAFHKAVSLVGEREGLDQEFVKIKSAPSKVIHWMKLNNWSVTLLFLLIAALLFSDLIYSSNHFVDVYEPLSTNYMYRSSDSNSYELMESFSKIRQVEKTFKYIPDPYSYKSIIPENSFEVILPNTKSVPMTEYRTTTIKTNFGSIDTITIEFPDNGLNLNNAFTFGSFDDPKEIWKIKSENKIDPKPVLICEATIFDAYYRIVLDDMNQFWIENNFKFTNNSPRIQLKPQALSKNKFYLDQSILREKIHGRGNTLFSIDYYPKKLKNSDFLLIKPIDPCKALLYQKETDLIQTIRLQLIQLPGQEYPILVWDEVRLVHKPVHLWDLLSFRNKVNSWGTEDANSR